MLLRPPAVGQWLKELPEPDIHEVDEALAYLEKYGRTAVMPDVLVPIATSTHYPDMGEVRVNLGNDGKPVDPDGGEGADRSYRILFVFGPDDQPILLVAGDKAKGGRWNDWYRAAVPAADNIYNELLAHRRRTQ